MQKNNAVILFLQESLARLFKKSPIFFQIWTWISVGLVLVTGLPDLINSLNGVVVIPDLWNAKITLAVAWASRAALFMSLLTVQSTPEVSDTGAIVKKTDEKALPFTAKTEQTIIDKQT